MKKISIIIVNYNVCQFLEQALRSLYKSLHNISAEVFVVDNCSVDGSVEMVRKKFPKTNLIVNENNVGFSSANNQAIKESNAEYILLLNPDTVVEEDTIQKCIDFMDAHPNGGGLGVKMVDGKGVFLPESKRSLPTPWVAFYKIFGLARLFPKSKKFGKYHLKYLNENETHEIEVLAGAFMLLRTSVLNKIGLLDEDYFMYGEDIDLSYRIVKAGYKNYYFSDTRIIHYKGESTKKTSVNYVFIFYNAMIIFAKKHFSKQNAWLLSLLINFAIYIRAGIEIVKQFVWMVSLPILDAMGILAGIYGLKEFLKFLGNKQLEWYPPVFYYIVIPGYVIIWLISTYFSGGYDKPFHFWKAFRGFLFGALLISTISNFVNLYHYSRLIIPVGTVLGLVWFSVLRYTINSLKEKRWTFVREPMKRMLVIGGEKETSRLSKLLKDAKINFNIVANIDPRKSIFNEHIFRVKEVIQIFKVDEVIFCSKDTISNEIIETMSKIDNKLVEYKIFPDESDFVIGSNSADSQGDIYMADIDFSITQPGNLRNKRMFDLLFSLTIFFSLPVTILFYRNRSQLISNAWFTIIGKLSWVGFSLTNEIKLPQMKRGILSTVSHLHLKQLSAPYAKRADLQYAKNYSIYTDLNIVFNSLNQLDKKI